MSREEEQIAYKYLKLISPAVAEAFYEIKAEAPVFVSPDVVSKVCNICNVHYSPLIYQVGYETRAQHFHRNEAGGIYLRLRDWFPDDACWLATVRSSEPIPRFTNIPKVESVEVLSIRAKCAFHEEELDNGLVILTTSDTVEGCGMRPICYEVAENFKKRRGCYDQWHFQIRDGVVSFRPVN